MFRARPSQGRGRELESLNPHQSSSFQAKETIAVSFAIILDVKHIKKLKVRIIVAVAVGIIFAYVGVGINPVVRPCAPTDVPKGESVSRCVSIEKVYANPIDILTNKQDKLTSFSETFAIASVTSFAILSVIGLIQEKKV